MMRVPAAHRMSGPLHRDGADWLLDVRVQPRASRTEFAGLLGDGCGSACRRLRSTAAPMRRCVEFVADACRLPKSRVTLEPGQTGRDKRVRLHGLQAIPVALQRALEA